MTEFDARLRQARTALRQMMANWGNSQPPESLSIRWPNSSDSDRKRMAETLSRELRITVKVVESPDDLDHPNEVTALRGAMAARKAAERMMGDPE